ncbi:hypothetical protein K7X08_011349 [Anisodus acutangulus]|uniref:Uncharacterized protein n=1 Tax=Anisodus acutangulus TaxID=402998 RepID=A0A9Q1M272_9SOLA|nr:hypothetical protein K7X08_011349 [Anisodus acutangulus]
MNVEIRLKSERDKVQLQLHLTLPRVFPAEACETIGGEACDVEIKTVFLGEACDALGGEFCEAEYQTGVY